MAHRPFHSQSEKLSYWHDVLVFLQGLGIVIWDSCLGNRRICSQLKEIVSGTMFEFLSSHSESSPQDNFKKLIQSRPANALRVIAIALQIKTATESATAPVLQGDAYCGDVLFASDWLNSCCSCSNSRNCSIFVWLAACVGCCARGLSLTDFCNTT